MTSRNNGYAARLIAAALATALLAFAGCTGDTEQAKTEEPTDLVWPLPPDPPRIKYVRSISSKEDIGAKDEASVASTLLGKDDQESIEQLQKPYAVHADKDGRIFVADTGWGKVLVFDPANKKFEVWGMSGPGTLEQPLGVVSDSEGRVYVADGKQQRVLIFGRDGSFLRAAGKKGELVRPAGIVVNEELNRIYVADVGAHHIAVFDMDGNHVSTIGERGGEAGQFNYPTNMAIDRQGKLYVVDTMNFRIQVFDPVGNLLVNFGQAGDGLGDFSRPKGIAVDSKGHIYVVDAAFGNIQIFDSKGGLLLFVGSSGGGPGQFQLPAGAYADIHDRLYVADLLNQRIQIFQYLGEPAEQPVNETVPAESPVEPASQ